VRPALEQLAHFLRALEVPFGIGVQQMPGLGDRRLVPDCRHYILQRPTVRRMVVHVVGRKQRQPVGPRQRVEPVDPRHVVAGMMMAGGNVSQRREAAGEMRQHVRE
jgi:hypothetical protein